MLDLLITEKRLSLFATDLEELVLKDVVLSVELEPDTDEPE